MREWKNAAADMKYIASDRAWRNIWRSKFVSVKKKVDVSAMCRNIHL